MWICLFLFYLANYFVIVFFNVALVSAASSRLAGGHATINDGLEVAWQRKGKIFQWALLSATVGIVLRMIEERASWLGRLVGGLIGMAWTLGQLLCRSRAGRGECRSRRGPAAVRGPVPEYLGRESGGRVQLRADLHAAGVARRGIALRGQKARTLGNRGGRGARRALLAAARNRQRRGTRDIRGCPLSLRQDKRCLRWLPPGRLLDGMAAEELNEPCEGKTGLGLKIPPAQGNMEFTQECQRSVGFITDDSALRGAKPRVQSAAAVRRTRAFANIRSHGRSRAGRKAGSHSRASWPSVPCRKRAPPALRLG